MKPPPDIPADGKETLRERLIGLGERYGAAKGRSIEVEGRRDGERVTLSVQDHGPGIPAGERERIFDLFYRGATGRSQEGTGVGLATVAKIARLAGGRAWVEETPGGGATFRVELLDPRPEDLFEP